MGPKWILRGREMRIAGSTELKLNRTAIGVCERKEGTVRKQLNQKSRTYAAIGQHATRLNAGHRGCVSTEARGRLHAARSVQFGPMC